MTTKSSARITLHGILKVSEQRNLSDLLGDWGK